MMQSGGNEDLPVLRLPDTLADGVVLLDAHRTGDAEAHLDGEDAEMRRRFDAERPATLEETRRAMARWIEGRAAGTPMFAYAVRLPSGELIGGCEIRMRSPTSANVSYWIYPPFRGRGYALRAVTLLCRAAKGVEGLERLEARIAPDNTRSHRVAEKAGFKKAGTVEERAWTGAVATMNLYVRPVRKPSRAPTPPGSTTPPAT
jgi:RimJ/RimL family protein N-acetyltransferase